MTVKEDFPSYLHSQPSYLVDGTKFLVTIESDRHACGSLGLAFSWPHLSDFQA